MDRNFNRGSQFGEPTIEKTNGGIYVRVTNFKNAFGVITPDVKAVTVDSIQAEIDANKAASDALLAKNVKLEAQKEQLV